jgi:3-deoxy-D-manno-octulosonic acid kinase
VSTNAKRTIVLSTDRSTIYYDRSLDVGDDPESWFDPFNPDLQSEIVQVGGRAAAWYIHLGDQACVLRHYHRGGLAAKFFVNQYLWTGIVNSRAVSEFLIMQSLHDAGLPVPQPLAAGVWRSGLSYRAALITARIESVVPLAQVSAPQAWENAGRAIAKIHHAEVWHADLNVFNVLIDPESCAWLIDFDRAKSGYLNPWQRSENLARLLRSVRKVCPEMEQDYWPMLTSAYAVEEQALLRIGRE